MVTDVDELGLAGLDPKATVVVATGNAHKISELEAILAPAWEGFDSPMIALCGPQRAGRLSRPGRGWPDLP